VIKLDRLRKALYESLEAVGCYCGWALNGRISIFYADDDSRIANLYEDGKVTFIKGYHGDCLKIADICGMVYEKYKAYENGEPLKYDGVEDYHKILEYDNHILAVRLNPNDSLQFVTWQTVEENKTAIWGHYFNNDFDAAKKDFAIHSVFPE